MTSPASDDSLRHRGRLFAAFVVGGVLGKVVPLWVVVLSVSRSEPPCSASSNATRAWMDTAGLTLRPVSRN
jgi:hypothetical protein